MKKKTTSAFLMALTFVCFALLPTAQAVVPAPDGGYPGGNTAEGQNALFSLSTGGFNTAIGFLSLRSDTTASFNTAVGAGALLANTGDENTATGVGTLLSLQNGLQNTANGAFALFSMTNNNANTATGYQALFQNNGGANTADGWTALHGNTTGQSNTAIGERALPNNTTGSNNTALGSAAGNNVTTASNVICIGAGVLGADVSNSCFIGQIFGTTSAMGIPVLINADNKLGTITSSKRFKEEIKPMNKASEAILALQPVTFHYKKKFDREGAPQFGLVAEDVEKVNPALVVRDKEGKPYSVRYDQVNAMLLNEFLKEHRKVEQQQATITELKSTVTKQEAAIAQQRNDFEMSDTKQREEIRALTGRVNEQAAQIQKAMAQLEITNPAQEIALSSR